MADGDGDGGGVEGGGSAEWQPIHDRVQAQAEALAARLEAASKVQSESFEAARMLQRSVEELQAAAREKDAEIERLRAEAADVRKKQQADASRRMRWEAAYMELILGANQKLVELRDGDVEDSRICAETTNAKEVESCAKLSQSTVDQSRVASDLGTELRKLKKAYETLSSKDKEVSALLSEKDGEIGRLQAEAIGAENKLQEMHSLVKEKDDEIQKLNGRHHESIEKRIKDISETHTKSRPDDPDATVRGKTENDGLRQILEEDYIPETETVEKDGQGETTQKRRHASSMSIDDAQSGSDADGDEQNGRDKDGDEQSGSDEDGDQQSRSDDDDGQSRGNEHDEDEDEQSGREETTNNLVQNPLGKRTRNACDAEFDDVRSHIGSNGKINKQTPPLPSSRDVQALHKLKCSKKLFLRY